MRERRDAGTVVLLMPAAILIVVLLAAIVIDASGAFLAERELADAAGAAANDAAAAAIDEGALRSTGEVRLDPALVCAVVVASLAATQSALVAEALARDPCPARVSADGRAVEVELHADADTTFATAIPGAPSHIAVGARRRAEVAG